MAQNQSSARAIAAGLSCGTGFAIPLIAFAATLPFDTPHSVVTGSAIPFAAGALAGVGTFALAHRLLEGPEDPAPASQDSHRTESVREERRRARREERARRRSMPKDVPIIARAADAPSEEDAWAEIDALLDDDSPISCDPARSKDIYQIAFEELAADPAPRAGSHGTGAVRTATGTDAAAGAAAHRRARADLDDTFMAIIDGGAGMPAATGNVTAPAYAAAAAASAGADTTGRIDADEPGYDTETARLAALDSLDTLVDDNGMPAQRLVARPAVCAAAPAASAHRPAPAAAAAPEPGMPARRGQRPRPSIPMADYSGHQDTWAAALAILAEAPEPAPAAEPERTAYVPRHAKPRASTSPTAVPPSAERAQAVAEGARATQMHSHVNNLIEEEFERVPSQSVRRTSRRYLSVIQGGTASMPAYRAEA